MARGWESKSVESQIEDAASRTDRRPALTPEGREIEQKRQGLELSRRRVQRELDSHSIGRQAGRAGAGAGLPRRGDPQARAAVMPGAGLG